MKQRDKIGYSCAMDHQHGLPLSLLEHATIVRDRPTRGSRCRASLQGFVLTSPWSRCGLTFSKRDSSPCWRLRVSASVSDHTARSVADSHDAEQRGPSRLAVKTGSARAISSARASSSAESTDSQRETRFQLPRESLSVSRVCCHHAGNDDTVRNSRWRFASVHKLAVDRLVPFPLSSVS